MTWVLFILAASLGVNMALLVLLFEMTKTLTDLKNTTVMDDELIKELRKVRDQYL